MKEKIMKKYTIEEIKKYLTKQDSFGDALYNLSEDAMDKAQEKIKIVDFNDKVILTIDEDVVDHNEIKNIVIEYMEEQGMEKSGHEEILSLEDLLCELEYDIIGYELY